MQQLLRRAFLLVIILSCITATGAYALRHFFTPAPLCDRCNIVLISLDAVNAHSFEDEQSAFPLLEERIKNDGIVFSHAYGPARQGFTGQAAILTGAYPWKLGMSVDPSVGIPLDAPTLPEILASYGYDTAGFATGALINTPWGFSRGFTEWNHSDEDAKNLLENAASWIKNRKEGDAPYFLFAAPYDLYHLIDTDGRSNDFSYENFLAASNGDTNAATRLRTGYVQKLSQLDASIAKVLDVIQQSPSGKNTVVIVTASFGQQFIDTPTLGIRPANLPTSKLLSVPLVFFIPGKASDVITPSVESRDTAKTILAIVGAQTVHFPGDSLIPYIEKQTEENQLVRTYIERGDSTKVIESPQTFAAEFARLRPDTIIVRAHAEPLDVSQASLSLIYDVWHVIQTPDGTKYLFNTVDDPEESKNVADRITQFSFAQQESIGKLLTGLLSEPK